MSLKLRLGVNIDHVATLRNTRCGNHPNIIRAASIALASGADNITVHLREDRRHIHDEDLKQLQINNFPLNLEMAATSEMLKIACDIQPDAVCLVPEDRNEQTTEGGLDVVSKFYFLKNYISTLIDAGIRVSLFIDACKKQIDAAKDLGVPVIEIHTGTYCNALITGKRNQELKYIYEAVEYGVKKGIEIHAGHGLSYNTVQPIAAIKTISTLNIGHFLIGEALFIGIENSIIKMRTLMNQARMS